MKNLSLISLAVVTLFVLQGCSDETKKTDLSEKKLNGKVKYMSEWQYTVEELEGGGLTFDSWRFNSKEGGKVDYIEFYYHENGQLDKFIYALDDSYLSTNYYVYNEKGLLERIDHVGSGSYYTTDFVYDEKDRIVKKIIGKEETNYEYNKDGYVIKEKHSEHVANKDGFIVESKYSSHTIRSKYDKKGNEIERICKLTDREVADYLGYGSHTIQSKYDKKGNEIERVFIPHEDFASRSVGYKILMKYDEYNNMVEEEEWYDNGEHSKRILTYEYDIYNNWIRQTTYWDESGKLKPTFCIERIIEYHDENTRTSEKGKDIFASTLMSNITETYEKAYPYIDILRLPYVKERLVNKYSLAYYNLLLRYTGGRSILIRSGRDYKGEYWESKGFGSIFRFDPTDSSIYTEVYLHGFQVERDGSLSIYPWSQKYYENEFGEKDETSPFFYIIEEFDESPGTEEDIEIRIDKYGVKFMLRNGWTDFHYGATIKVKATDGSEVLELPIKEYKGILYLTWNDEETYKLIDLWSRKNTIVSIIDTDVLDKTHRYIKEFECMERVKLIVMSLSEN